MPIKAIIDYIEFPTPIGTLCAGATDQGICLLDFTDKNRGEAECKDLCKKLSAVIQSGSNPYLDQVKTELSEYFSGDRRQFSVPLHTPGTDFQRSVWRVLQDIPYSETRSYKQQAAALNNPGAIRAVASANGRNRVSIIIPCHRVIGSDGQLVGYGGGLDRKKWLLDFEAGV